MDKLPKLVLNGGLHELFLMPTLEFAVALRIMEIKKMGYVSDDLVKATQDACELLISPHSDQLLFGGKHCKETFNAVALAIAVLSFQPGGIKALGFSFESTFD